MPTEKITKDGSSQRGARSRTKGATTGKTWKHYGSTSRRGREVSTDWQRLDRMSPAAIRKGILADPDAHPTDAAFWKNAKLVMPTPKTIVTMRLDTDLLRWFRQRRGYQTRINAILRAYMEARA